MKCKKIFVCCAISLTIGLIGCRMPKTEQTYSIQTPEKALLSWNRNVYENGLVYANQNAAYFLDYPTFTGTPLCNQPNCTHQGNSCIAKIVVNFGMNGTPPVIYQDNIYYFTKTEGIVDSEDGKFTSYRIDCQLHQIDVSSGDQTVLCKFEGMEATCSSCVYLDGNTLYFIANNGSLQDNAGGWSYFTSAGVQYLCSVDFDSGAFTNLGQVNTAEHVDSTLFAKDGGGTYGVNGDVRIQGMYDGKLWMSYYYADSSDALMDLLQETGDFPGIEDPVWHAELVAYDFDTQEISRSEAASVPCIGEGYYIDWDSEQEQYIAKQEDGEITLTDFPKADLLRIVNNLVFDEYEMDICFDLSDQKLKKINPEYTEKGISVVDFQDESYIVQYYNTETDAILFEAVSESDLLGE